MKPLFECYRRLLPTAQLRSQVYWGYSGACFSEETENFGLVNPTAYGLNRPEGFDKGREYHPSSEYEWDGVLETCRMVLDAVSYDSMDISRYIPLIESSLNFFDVYYRGTAARRGYSDLDGKGKLVLYPASAGQPIRWHIIRRRPLLHSVRCWRPTDVNPICWRVFLPFLC